jgi:hypothetical protein
VRRRCRRGNVERPCHAAAAAHGRALACAGDRLVDGARDPRRARLLLGPQRVVAGGPHPGSRPHLPERLLPHVLRLPPRRDRRGVLPRVRHRPAPATRRRLAGLRGNLAVGCDRRNRRPRDRRQLHVPAFQARHRLAAEHPRAVAALHRRRGDRRSRDAADSRRNSPQRSTAAPAAQRGAGTPLGVVSL